MRGSENPVHAVTHDVPTAAPTSVLAATGVACRRGTRLLFQGLDFRVAPGQVVWLRGANGRGKTSLLRLLAGLSAPEAGVITWDGRPVRRDAAYQRQLTFIAHANALKDDLTVAEALRFLVRLHGRDAGDDALREALACFGLASRSRAPVRTLSQGQRRRVALARLGLSRPGEVWILDEPFDALDTEGIATLNALLSAHAAAGGRVVLTSHQALTLAAPSPVVLQLEDAAP